MIAAEQQTQPALLTGISRKTLSDNVLRILQELQSNHPQNQEPPKLIAVTKTVAPDVVNQLISLGIHDIAESRVQAALPKLCHLSPDYRLNWIGRLQTNKVKSILPHISLLQSLDRLELAQEVNRRAGEANRVLPALVQVNIAGEQQKAGIPPEALTAFLHQLKSFSSISIKGLMAIMPIDADEESLTALFHRMKVLFDQIKSEGINNIEMRELSMGMSRDYVYAAREGATMVRIGTALYR